MGAGPLDSSTSASTGWGKEHGKVIHVHKKYTVSVYWSCQRYTVLERRLKSLTLDENTDNRLLSDEATELVVLGATDAAASDLISEIY